MSLVTLVDTPLTHFETNILSDLTIMASTPAPDGGENYPVLEYKVENKDVTKIILHTFSDANAMLMYLKKHVGVGGTYDDKTWSWSHIYPHQSSEYGRGRHVYRIFSREQWEASKNVLLMS